MRANRISNSFRFTRNDAAGRSREFDFRIGKSTKINIRVQ